MSTQVSTTNAAPEWDLVEASILDTTVPDDVADVCRTFKESIDSIFASVVQQMNLSNEDFDAKFKVLNEMMAGIDSHISILNSHIAEIKILVQEECKQKHLERAHELTDLGSFTYYKVGYTNSKKSSELAREAIGWFMLDKGFLLPNAKLRQHPDEPEESKAAFRQKFKRQIKDLIKREPRMLLNEDGGWMIYYA